MSDNGSRVHAFLRFDDIIGTNPGQIPPNAIITSAALVFNATSSTKGKVIMHRMLVPWGEHSTWMDFTPTGTDGQQTSSDGWDFETAEGKQPPALVVVVEGVTLVQ